jgi:hypothetical protein
VATSRVEGKDFDGVEPEAAKREPTLGGCGIRRAEAE